MRALNKDVQAGESMVEDVYIYDNPYGYQLNIAHPLINKLYFRYKDSKGIGHSIPLSDQERWDFEAEVIRWMERRKHGQETAKGPDPGEASPNDR